MEIVVGTHATGKIMYGTNGSGRERRTGAERSMSVGI